MAHYNEGGYLHRHPVNESKNTTSLGYSLMGEWAWKAKKVREFIECSCADMTPEELSEWVAYRILLEQGEDPLETR
jgi:hypothetical protein